MIPTTLTIIAISILSSLTSLSLSATIAAMPRNGNFQRNVEYSQVFHHYISRTWFILTQILFACCVLSQMVASIVSTSQVVDAFVATLHGQTYALSFPAYATPSHTQPFHFTTWTDGDCDTGTECLPFSPARYSPVILTLGYILTTLALLPLCLKDMKENEGAQVLSFVLLLVFGGQFIYSFASTGFHKENIIW